MYPNIFAAIGVIFVNLVAANRIVNYTCKMDDDGYCAYHGVSIYDLAEASNVELLAPRYDMTRIKFLDSSPLFVLPDRIYSTFPNMLELKVWAQGLHSIYISPNLLHLDAEKNRIQTISFDTNTVPLLKKLELAHNRLKSIPPNITYFENLEFLDLRNNDLRSLDLCQFQRLRYLRTLDLSASNMAIVKNSMEHKLESLTVLHLNDNRLTYLDINVLRQFPNLETLTLFKNGLMYMEYENMKTMFPKLNRVQINDNDWHCENLAEMLSYFKKVNIWDYKLFSVYGSMKCKERVLDGICCSEGKALSILKKSNLYFSNYVNELNLHSHHIIEEMKQSKREIQKLIEHENMTQASLQAFSADMNAIRDRIENITMLAADSSSANARHRKHEKVDKLVQEIYKIKQDHQSLTRENQAFKQQIEGYEQMKAEMGSIRTYSEEMRHVIQELKEENSHLKNELHQLLAEFHELRARKNADKRV